MSRVTFLVIPSEVEESLTFGLSSIRDVSTPLAMTKNGQHESDLVTHKFPVRTVSIFLATVLVIAGGKLIFTR
jgi:hypothetical protein